MLRRDQCIVIWNGYQLCPWMIASSAVSSCAISISWTAVIQSGSMGKAATALAMTQSAVSNSIADLEHTLGIHLLDRSRRGIEPTMYGRALN